MASKSGRARPVAARPQKPVPKRSPRPSPKRSLRGRLLPLVAVLGVVAVLVFVGITLVGAASKPRAIHDISVTQLRTDLGHKDFTLLNVKTPYIGEISGTDLYIPYDQLSSRASELPADRNARIVVYCRTGNESTIASQTLESLGYRDIDNLSGGMQAWTAAGGTLVQLNR